MRFWDLVSLISENLRRRKGRVVLTAIGVVIGTAAVVLLVSLATGLQKSATSNLWGITDLSRIEVYPNYGEGMVMEVPMGGGGGGKAAAPPTRKLLTPTVLEEIAAIPGVKSVIPRDYLYGQGVIQFGKFETWAGFMGVKSENLEDLGYDLDRGSLDLRKGTIIAGSWMAQNFYVPNLRPGQEMPVMPDLLDQRVKLVLTKWTSDGQMVTRSVNLQVVGVLKEMRNEADSQFFVVMDDLDAWNEWFNNGHRINRNKDGYNNVIVRAESPEVVMDVTQQINDMGFMAYSPQSTVEGINSFFVILQIVFGGIGAIALLVAAIGIANTMTMAILERTREIGLMKAVGATNRDVLTIFLGEAAGIGFLGGLGGAILGWIGGYILNVVSMQFLASQAQEQGYMSTSLSAETPLWLLLFAIIFATLVGFLSGLYPALRAATLEPVTALKYE
ncbi:MAG: ABC transporter permease [Anaerolineaceae bacterium]|nr:ABC transporter permease [Anaerolineaceae bacterium]